MTPNAARTTPRRRSPVRSRVSNHSHRNPLASIHARERVAKSLEDVRVDLAVKLCDVIYLRIESDTFPKFAAHLLAQLPSHTGSTHADDDLGCEDKEVEL